MSGLSSETHRPTSGPPVCLLRLDRADRRNALDLATVEALLQALRAEPDQTVVLGSTTPGTFCAGADLTVTDAERARLSDLLYECYDTILRRPGLVLAAVDGPAVGGGAQLAAAADLRVAGPAARWRWVGPGHGLAVGAWILPDLLGRSRALDLTLTGRWLDLEEAQASGFVHRVAHDVWSTTRSLLEELGAAEPSALQRVKALATRPHLSAALAEERGRNRESWSGRAPARPSGGTERGRGA